jgi:hypothetical protein
MLLFYLVLFFFTGFRVIGTFETALVEQSKHLAGLVRPYPRTIVFDLTDFALGAGWLAFLLAGMTLLNPHVDRTARNWCVLAIAQIVLLSLIGLMQAETARIWCFLLPLLMLAASAELSRWPRPARLLTYAAAWLLMCCVGQNMAFMF